MRRLLSLPLLYFFLAGLMGLLLRWQFFAPVEGVMYRYWLHAHSHAMFLGWVFNALFLGFVTRHIKAEQQQPFRLLFYLLQIFLVGMMIAFPLQGYGRYAIVFSTLHTVVAVIFIVRFFGATSGMGTASIWFARAALLFFILSAAGPVALGFLMANGMGQTKWYHFAVYFYLHFQYNGVFILGIFSLFLQLLEDKGIAFQHGKVKTIGWWMALSCIAAYSLSVLWAQPGLLVNAIGLLSAAAQMFALFLFIRFYTGIRDVFRGRFSGTTLFYLYVTFTALVLKLILQLISAHPLVAEMAGMARPVVIAYIHLVVLGIISLFLFVWYIESDLIRVSFARIALAFFLIGFTGSEAGLIAMPWWSELSVPPIVDRHVWMFIFSAAIVFASAMLVIGRKNDG